MDHHNIHLDTSPKIVWVISDGIPGHFNQSKGVLLALESQFPIQVEWIEAKLKKSFYRRVLNFILNRFIPNIQFFSWFYQLSPLPANKPDIVVGAGGKSAYAIAWLANAYAAKSIFCGSLRQLKSSLFDAIIVLESDLPAPFISVSTSAMPISQQKLKEAAQRWQETHLLPQRKRWAILIGGDGAGAKYQLSDWLQLAEQLNTLAEQYQIQWLISTSRRTGAVAEQVLKTHVNSTAIDDAVWWSEEQRPVIASFLGLSDVVLCTVDSMSMMMESISAMRPVIALQPKEFNPDSKYAAVMQRLENQKLIQISELTHLVKGLDTSQLKPLTEEPTVILGKKLSKLF